MTVKLSHIAVIPARAGSVGVPGKNQMFFDSTAKFINKISWFDKVLVSTDDDDIKEKAKAQNYIVHNRPESLAGSAVSIKSVFEDLVQSLEIADNVVLWLFYIPLLFKRLSDFNDAKLVVEQVDVKSLCTFIPAKTHPYNTWLQDTESKNMTKCIDNDVFRRQDMPPAWEHYHYVCCFKAAELPYLNNELLNTKTYPLFLSESDADNLIEIDTPEDLARWKDHHSNLTG
jgi:CMP-N-acetylneuraminic acid synthetase